MKNRFTEEQIVKILGQEAEGKKIKDTCREYGIALATYYIWKKKYANMSVSKVMELKILRAENAKLQKLVATLSLDNMVQQDIIRKYCSLNKKVCELSQIARTTYLYKFKRISEDFIIKKMKNILKKIMNMVVYLCI